MPNIKSSKKRVLVNAKKNAENKNIRSAVKTEIKKIDELIKLGNIEEAKANLASAFKIIDAACSKGILHKNNAANKKAKLSKKCNAIPQVIEETSAVEEVKTETVVADEPAPAPVKKPRAKKKPVEETAE